jgi:hypothetical protein
MQNEAGKNVTSTSRGWLPGALLGVSFLIALSLFYSRKSKMPEPSLRHVIVTAEKVSVSQVNRVSVGPSLAMVDKQTNTNLLTILRSTKQFDSSVPKKKADFLLTVIAYNGKFLLNKPHPPQYYFISATGELGSGREWCVVPSEFKTWVQKLNRVPVNDKLIEKDGVTIVTP